MTTTEKLIGWLPDYDNDPDLDANTHDQYVGASVILPMGD